MAASRSMASPWNICKRLKIQPLAQVLPPQRAYLNTSTPKSAETPAPQAVAPATLNTQPSSPSGPQIRSRRTGPAISVSPQDAIRASLIQLANERNIPLPPAMQDPSSAGPPRLPRSVQALYLAPMRRTPTHGIPVCNLQLRSYSVRNLEFMADFALRAAYYLNLPAKGPVPLPKITQRWTVPRDVFIFKKSQENYERVTCRRLIQIQDGHPDVVRRWLGFVKRHVWYGVGMKADVFEWEGEDVVRRMDEDQEAVEVGLEKVDWELFGRRKGLESEEEVAKLLAQQGFAGAAKEARKESAERPA